VRFQISDRLSRRTLDFYIVIIAKVRNNDLYPILEVSTVMYRMNMLREDVWVGLAEKAGGIRESRALKTTGLRLFENQRIAPVWAAGLNNCLPAEELQNGLIGFCQQNPALHILRSCSIQYFRSFRMGAKKKMTGQLRYRLKLGDADTGGEWRVMYERLKI
jgi:hypothetical protein